MKKAISTILLASAVAGAQTTTNCTSTPNGIGGVNTQCQSNTPPAGPDLHDRIMEQQRRNAQAYGNAGGGLAAALIIHHKLMNIKKQECHQNGAGSTWIAKNLITGQVVAGGVCSAKDAK